MHRFPHVFPQFLLARILYCSYYAFRLIEKKTSRINSAAASKGKTELTGEELVGKCKLRSPISGTLGVKLGRSTLYDGASFTAQSRQGG
jgi:hypothetical protein